jgi:radical SAM protein with 4Fe4S-binding SPASM domain
MNGESRLGKLTQAARLAYHWKVRKSLVLPVLPASIGIETTNRCNFKCAFCPQSNPDHFDTNRPSEITPDTVVTLLRKIREAGVTTGIMHWTLDGEPFMNKRFAQIVERAGQFGFKTHNFASNAMLMTPARLRELPKDGFQYFILPDYCSDEEYFERYRGTPGSWKIVRENLRAAIGGEEFAHIRFHVGDISGYTLRDPAELQRRFRELKAMFPLSDRIAFYPVTYHNYSGKVSPPATDATPRPRTRYNLCPYPWSTVNIASNGDIVACCRDSERQTVLGNLFEQSFLDIWNGEKYRDLRRDLRDEHPERQAACDGCSMPHDRSKFSMQNLLRAARQRLLLFK